MRYITIGIFILAFFLLHPFQLEKFGLKYAGDDDGYFAHASSLVYGDFPSYKNEYFFVGKGMPMHSIGPGLMAAPSVFLFSLLDRAEHKSIVIKRTVDNVYHSWSLFGFVVATSLYFWFSCLLLYKGLRLYYNENTATGSIILMVLCQGLALYVYRRPVFSHIYEFFGLSLLMYLLLLKNKRSELNRPVDNKIGFLILTGIACALVTLVRFNNALYSILFPMIIFFMEGTKKININWGTIRKVVVTYVIAGIFFCFFYLLPYLYNHASEGYGSILSVYAAKHFTLTMLFDQLIHIFISANFGLLYTAPFLIASIAALFLCKYPIKKQILIVAMPLIINFGIPIVFMDNGTFYGYRYIIFTAIPLLIFPFSALLNVLLESHFKKRWCILITIIALVPLLSQLLFDGNSTTLTLYLNDTNPFYEMNVLKIVLFHPIEFGIALFKGGVLYFIYLFTLISGIKNHLPVIVQNKYPSFNITLMIRVIILYLLPFLLYGGYCFFKRNKSKYMQNSK